MRAIDEDDYDNVFAQTTSSRSGSSPSLALHLSSHSKNKISYKYGIDCMYGL